MKVYHSMSFDWLTARRGLHIVFFILEKVVASRIQSHLLSNSLSSSFQSAYRMFHSTETTLLSIHNDLILAMDRGEVTSLILLDFICCLWYCRSFYSSSSSSTLVWSSWHFSRLVFILSYLTFSSSLHPKFHFIFLKSFLWCTSRFRPWPTSIYSLYHSSWFCHLQELNQISPLCWWHPVVHLSHAFKFNFFTWNTFQYLHWHTLLDELKQIAPQSVQNWISTYRHKATATQIFSTHNFISWQMISSQSALLLVILASSLIQTCHSQIKLTPCLSLVAFISETYCRIRHLLPLSAATALANSLVSSKLDYCNSLYNGISQANLYKIQRIQNTLARVVTNTSKFEHITPILKKLHWLPIKQRIDYKLCLLTYKTLKIQQPTYLFNSLSFPSHSLSTRSSDSSVLSIPYVSNISG